MGRDVASGAEVVEEEGFSEAWSWLMRWDIVLASSVLPEPGMPLTAIMRRALEGVEQYFAGGGMVVSLGFWTEHA
jgi:hypothetical protein